MRSEKKANKKNVKNYFAVLDSLALIVQKLRMAAAYEKTASKIFSEKRNAQSKAW